MKALKKAMQMVKNMGPRYIAFRSVYEIQLRTGIFKRRFPQNPVQKKWINLEEWKRQPASFFIDGKLNLGGPEPDELLTEFNNLKEGKLRFFNGVDWMDIGKSYDWLTNPENNYRYPSDAHWTSINDYDPLIGDIKYVWEKSRFSFLYTIIRHDAYSGEDNSQWVWDEILSWIKANPINSGPNYKCSQETSLRVSNWTFALNFYKDAVSLTENIFQEIMHAIYWQLRHVYSNIHFSRIAVRNNHALTETLALYMGGILFPFFPEAAKWKIKGKKWFESEIAYQVYEDGTFLQFSMNYHRVVIQLLCWGFSVTGRNDEAFAPIVYERAYKSLNFLFQCQEKTNGWLPNYGANDGALFFKFTDADFRDFRPQLNCLHIFLTGTPLYNDDVQSYKEEAVWFGAQKGIIDKRYPELSRQNGWHIFDKGGYFILREEKGLTFIRCGDHKDRPSQADNLHLDIWYEGKNILFDGGSYKYNTDASLVKYFRGTASHNTVMLNDYDQMQKGGRFIWYNWTQKVFAKASETGDYYTFAGEITSFSYIKPGIVHKRTIKKHKDKPEWLIIDEVVNKPNDILLRQILHPMINSNIKFISTDINGDSIAPTVNQGFSSPYYGYKQEVEYYAFETANDTIQTQLVI